MHLVRSVIRAIQNCEYRELSESEIKVFAKKARRDYGTTNNTLRRLCKHGVLRRQVGLCRTTDRPSYLYSLDMSDRGIENYIDRKEKQMAAARDKRLGNHKLFCFGTEHEINTGWNDGNPLMIGVGVAPDGLEYKCLVVNGGYEMQITENEHGSQILSFKKKSL